MSDPALNVSYRVTLDGFISLGFWTKVEGLGMEYEVTTYREGGVNGYEHKIIGPVKFTNLRLSRPVDSTSPADHDLARQQPDRGDPAPDDGDHRDDRGGRGRSRPGTCWAIVP